MAYRLALIDSLMCMHDVFHVLGLHQYISDPSHVIDMSSLQVLDEGSLISEPLCILDHCTQQLLFRLVDQVKVKWNIYCQQSTTWEDAHEMSQ
jgi:hypothetical protein